MVCPSAFKYIVEVMPNYGIIKTENKNFFKIIKPIANLIPLNYRKGQNPKQKNKF